eukprot:TRINITY_DN15708_c0_g1::TRINITY_DN15708_c0_g1_i1::g.18778::m.18778 TRINITY_DN15708_c0_g1::TRINITY_DN15708_c0_g1_i1::g.18778  ORF type:complete len:260 (+),score=8.94,sp/Q9FGF0/PGML1_ARATH/37.19/6e-42,His_Phos_1/PF00300.17/2.1e-20 TRINITY_DN15708_c0_g1_i1:32-781(+)
MSVKYGAEELIFYEKHQCKTIHFIRHAQGLHNAAAETKGRAAYFEEAFFDSDLTDLGRKQVEDCKQQLQGHGGLSPDLVVVSPLVRALNTAGGIFHFPAHKVIVKEDTRERIGVHPCDRRRRKSELIPHYPTLDWTEIEEEDIYWCSDKRETEEEMAVRGARFIRWLVARPEHSIVVVTHSSYLSTLFNRVLGHTVSDAMKRWFNNCEIRTLIMPPASPLLTPTVADHMEVTLPSPPLSEKPVEERINC